MKIGNNMETRINNILAPYIERIRLLEKAVFGPPPGSGPTSDIQTKLNQIDKKINSIHESILNNINKLDKKYDKRIKETIEVVAELKKIISHLEYRKRYNHEMGA